MGPLFYLLSVSWLVVSIYWSYDGSWFQYHPIFMNLAIFGGVSYAFVQESKQTGTQKHFNHMYAQILSVLMMSFAFYVIWTNKDMKGKSHLTTWHSWVGVAAWGLFLLQCSIAYFGMNPNKTPKEREVNKTNHVYFGYFIYLLLLVSVVLGYGKHVNYSNFDAKFFMWAFSVIAALYSFVAFSVNYGARNQGAQKTK